MLALMLWVASPMPLHRSFNNDLFDSPFSLPGRTFRVRVKPTNITVNDVRHGILLVHRCQHMRTLNTHMSILHICQKRLSQVFNSNFPSPTKPRVPVLVWREFVCLSQGELEIQRSALAVNSIFKSFTKATIWHIANIRISSSESYALTFQLPGHNKCEWVRMKVSRNHA
jgi:hypothetical protein